MAWLYNSRKVPALLVVAEATFSVPQVGFSSQALQRFSYFCGQVTWNKETFLPHLFPECIIFLFLLLEGCDFFFLLLFL